MHAHAQIHASTIIASSHSILKDPMNLFKYMYVVTISSYFNPVPIGMSGAALPRNRGKRVPCVGYQNGSLHVHFKRYKTTSAFNRDWPIMSKKDVCVCVCVCVYLHEGKQPWWLNSISSKSWAFPSYPTINS